MKRSEEPCWIAIAEARHSLSHTVTGLVPQDSYSFRVRAENAHGLSEPSAISDLVTVPGENDEEIGGQVFTAEINQIEIEEEGKKKKKIFCESYENFYFHCNEVKNLKNSHFASIMLVAPIIFLFSFQRTNSRHRSKLESLVPKMEFISKNVTT